MRHGDAEKRVTDCPQRRLTTAGEAEADAGGLFLRISGEIPDVIMHSSQLRSIMTAEHVMAAIGSGVPELERRDDLEEDSSPEDFLEKVTKKYMGSKKRILAVGHNPFISRLGALMLTGSRSASFNMELKTGELLGAGGAGKNGWRLRFSATPRVLAEIYKAYSGKD